MHPRPSRELWVLPGSETGFTSHHDYGMFLREPVHLRPLALLLWDGYLIRAAHAIRSSLRVTSRLVQHPVQRDGLVNHVAADVCLVTPPATLGTQFACCRLSRI